MDELKYKFGEIISEIEKLSKKFELLEEKTSELKRRYNSGENNDEFLNEIKKHEEEYKRVYEKMLELTNRAKHLRNENI